MRKNMKTINEEIDRIKSLFTEERLFGNLVEQEEDPFSKKSARKSKKSQNKDDKDITKTKGKRDKDIKKDERQYRRALGKFCKKEVGKLVNVFIVKKNRLEVKPEGLSSTWDDLLKTYKSKYPTETKISNDEGKENFKTEEKTYYQVIQGCSSAFSSEELGIKSYAGKAPKDILQILLGVTDTTKGVDERNKLFINLEGGVKEKVKDVTGIDTLKAKLKSIGSSTFANDKNLTAGDLFVNLDKDGFLYLIKPRKSYTPVKKLVGGKFGLYDSFKKGIETAVKDLKNKVEKESTELKGKLPDSLDGITFVDNKKFTLPKPQ
jgi:hypothetical protein